MFASLKPFSVSVVRPFVSFLSLLTFTCAYASAMPITFTGEDLNAGPGSAHPNSAAAAASFDASAAAIGNVSTITFEGAPVGAFSTLSVAPGVTISGADYTGSEQTIQNSPSYAPVPSLGGFNTTPGGSEYVNMIGGTLTFDFATPTQFFGAYLSGVQTYFFQDTVTFSDGTTQTIDVPGAGTTGSTGALDFVGFTDAGKSISSVTINASNSFGADEIGVDDVQYQSSSTSPVPEPSSLTLMFSGIAAFGVGCRRFLAARA